MGVGLVGILVFSVESIAPSVSAETLLYVRGFADVVAACNVGIGFLLIISSSIRYFHSARKVLLGELVLMPFLLIVSVFNTLNSDILVDAGPPPPFWIILIANPFLCTYGLMKGKNCCSNDVCTFAWLRYMSSREKFSDNFY